jgi:hypothetical protein
VWVRVPPPAHVVYVVGFELSDGLGLKVISSVHEKGREGNFAAFGRLMVVQGYLAKRTW